MQQKTDSQRKQLQKKDDTGPGAAQAGVAKAVRKVIGGSPMTRQAHAQRKASQQGAGSSGGGGNTSGGGGITSGGDGSSSKRVSTAAEEKEETPEEKEETPQTKGTTTIECYIHLYFSE